MDSNVVKELLETEPQIFNSFQNFESSLTNCGLFNIEHNNGFFEGLFIPKAGSNNKLFVCLSGARAGSKSVLPHIQRWKWNQKFKGSTLYISDPSFRYNQNLSLGWYIGTQEHDWLKDLAELIKIFAYKQNLKSSDVILYGSSAGDYAAMKLTELIEGSVAIAINPQTDIRKYLPDFVKSFLKSNFNTEQLDILDNRFTTMVQSRKNNASKIFLYQNINDTFHYENHLSPFIKYFNLESICYFANNSLIVAKSFIGPKGHGPEPTNKVDYLISLSIALSNNDYNEANRIVDLL